MLRDLYALVNPIIGAERCGFILNTGEIVEVDNIHPNKLMAFQMPYSEYERYQGKAVASWHTHPITTANLSVDDYHLFLNLSHLTHYILSPKGWMCYRTVNGSVMVDDYGNPPI